MLISMREACVGVSSVECSSHTRSYLEKMTSVRLVPVESTTIQETMESLGLNFSLDPVVTKALLATKIQNLEEFRFLFEDESKVDTFLAKLQLGEDRLIQGSKNALSLDSSDLILQEPGPRQVQDQCQRS